MLEVPREEPEFEDISLDDVRFGKLVVHPKSVFSINDAEWDNGWELIGQNDSVVDDDMNISRITDEDTLRSALTAQRKRGQYTTQLCLAPQTITKISRTIRI
jgi:hypothetical protein